MNYQVLLDHAATPCDIAVIQKIWKVLPYCATHWKTDQENQSKI